MAFTTFINIITAIFCFAVLVQSLRMMRSLDAVKGAGAALPHFGAAFPSVALDGARSVRHVASARPRRERAPLH